MSFKLPKHHKGKRVKIIPTSKQGTIMAVHEIAPGVFAYSVEFISVSPTSKTFENFLNTFAEHELE